MVWICTIHGMDCIDREGTLLSAIPQFFLLRHSLSALSVYLFRHTAVLSVIHFIIIQIICCPTKIIHYNGAKISTIISAHTKPNHMLPTKLCHYLLSDF